MERGRTSVRRRDCPLSWRSASANQQLRVCGTHAKTAKGATPHRRHSETGGRFRFLSRPADRSGRGGTTGRNADCLRTGPARNKPGGGTSSARAILARNDLRVPDNVSCLGNQGGGCI